MTSRSETTATNLRASLDLAARGLLVFPARPDNRPYTQRGHYDATSDHDAIQQWMDNLADAVPALPAGENGFLVVDCDIKPGIDGVTNWEDQCSKNGVDLSGCLIVETPSGGRHYYFAQGDGIPLRNSAGKIGPGIDTRGGWGLYSGPRRDAAGRTGL